MYGTSPEALNVFKEPSRAGAGLCALVFLKATMGPGFRV